MPSHTVLLAAAGLLSLSCTPFTFRALTAPLGDDTIASRDDLRLTIFNRTPFRAIFTIGMFNTFDQTSQPQFVQFADGQNGTLLMPADSTQGPLLLVCDRTLGIGSTELLRQTTEFNRLENLNQPALIEGVAFSAANLDDPLGLLPTEGTAAGINIFQGAEFPCEAELLIFFEQDPSAPGGFRIAFQAITPP